MRSSKLALAIIACVVVAQAQPQPPRPQAAPANQDPASIEGEVRNAITGAPIERAHVTATLNNNQQQRYGVLTDAAGKFTIIGLPPGSYAINLDRVGFVASVNRVETMLNLSPAQKYQNLKLKLTPTGAIVGRVLDADGQPMEGIVVRTEVGGQTGRSAMTDDRGMYRIGGLRPGKVRVMAEVLTLPFPPEIRTDGTVEVHYSPTYHPSALDPSSAMRVWVVPATEVTGVDIRMIRTPLIHISGKVTGIPEGGRANLMMQPRGMGSQVKPDGTFEILRANPGKYTLTAMVSNGGMYGSLSSGPVQVVVGDQDVENLQIPVYRTDDLKGQVLYEDEEARKPPAPPAGRNNTQMPNRRLILTPVGSSQMGSSTGEIKEDGSFTLTRVGPGTYRAWIANPGPQGSVYVRSMSLGRANFDGARLDLSAGVPGEIPLVVHVASAKSTLSGTVTDDKGPVAGLHVVLAEESLERGWTSMANTKADGSYSLTGIAPGKYRLILADDADRDEIQTSLEGFDDVAIKLDVGEHDTLTKDLKRKPVIPCKRPGRGSQK